MTDKNLKHLCDLAEEAHTHIQRDYKEINPIVGVSKKMRALGIPADTMTIDCRKSGRRIIIILHDHQADTLSYQFSMIEKDPDKEFKQLKFKKLTAQLLYDWMKNYFHYDA